MYIYIACFLSIAILSGWIVIDPSDNVGERHIGHSDQANNADLARNIAEGKGPVVNIVWLLTNGGMPGNDIPRAVSYISVYQGYLFAFFFKLMGATRQTILFVGCIFRTMIAALSVYSIYKLRRDLHLAFVCGFVLLLHPVMLVRNNGLFDIYLTMFMFLATISLIFSIQKNSNWLRFIGGLLIGVSFGFKVSGLIVIIAYYTYLILCPDRILHLRKSVYALLGVLLAITPMSLYNKVYFNTFNPMPAATKLVILASTIRFQSANVLHGHNKGFLDPTVHNTLPQLTLNQNVRMAKSNLLAYRRGIFRGEVIPVWMFPFVWLGFCFLAVKTWKEKKIPTDMESLWGFFALLTAIGGLCLAIKVHYEARYLNFIVPMLMVVGMSVLDRFPRVILIGILLFTFMETIGPHRLYSPERLPSQYETIKNKLPENAIVLTSNPAELSFHTRLRSVSLPYTDNKNLIIKTARRYGAEYIVIINRDARHTYYDDLERGIFPEYLQKVAYSDDLVIARMSTDRLNQEN